MNCYYHPNEAAVGICRHCQRGLCPNCISEVDDCLACKDRHEEQVGIIELVTQRSLLQSQRLGSAYIRNAIFYALVGLLFAGFGILQVRWMGWQGIFLFAIGFFLLYAAVANFLESRKY